MTASRWQEPNLARNPFVNERPIWRLALLLWLLAVSAGAVGFWRSQAIRQETETRVAELARLNSETTIARERAVTVEADLRKANLADQNLRVEFLNQRFAERTFSWNGLLDALTREMPRGVRLMRLSPEGFARSRSRRGAGAENPSMTRVELKISGEAEETEALLEFVDRLFQQAAFDQPNLSRESTKKDSRIQFDIAVDYLPQVARSQAPARAASAGAAAGPAETLTATGSAVEALAPGGGPNAGQAPVAGVMGPKDSRRAGPAGRQLQAASPGAATADVTGSAAFLAGKEEEEAAGKPDGGRADGWAQNGRGRGANNLPAGGGPVFGGGGAMDTGSRSGSRPAPGVPVPGAPVPAGGGQPRFPASVMPTPLRPYASTIGGVN